MQKRKLNIAMEVLLEVSVTFQDIEDFINEKLEEKCAKGNIPVEELIIFRYFTLFVGKTFLKKLKIVVLSLKSPKS